MVFFFKSNLKRLHFIPLTSQRHMVQMSQTFKEVIVLSCLSSPPGVV